MDATSDKQRLWAHLALLGANLIYGIGFSVAKTVMPSKIAPQGFILLRVACATVLLWTTVLLGKNFRSNLQLNDIPRLVLCAATGIAINMLLFFAGLSLTTPIHGSLMMLATPILVSVLASIILKEQFTSSKVLGLGLGVGGAVLLITQRQSDAQGSNILLGDIFILINACSYALYLIIVKPLMHKYRPIVVLRYVFTIGLLMVLPFGYTQLQAVDWHSFSQAQILSVLFIVIGVTFLTYLWNIYAVTHLPSSTAGAYIYAQPVFAALVSVLFFGETLSYIKLLAAILIFCGVWLATKSAAPKQSN